MSVDTSMPGSPAQQFQILLQRLTGSKQWDRALDVARDWLAQEPDNAHPHLAAAQALVNLKRYPEAETHVAKVVAAWPNSSFAFRLGSVACLGQEKMEKSNEHIQRAIELAPNDAMNWYQLALIRYRQGSPDTAERYARRALELQPDNADTINLIAICQRGNPQAQYQQYLRALELAPENSTVHTNLGIHYLNTRDYPAAEKSFRRALQCDPTNESAQKNLFLVLRWRDPLYRVLTWPRTLLQTASWARRDRGMAVRIALVLVWLTVGRIFFWVLAAWLLLVLPILKAYEHITISDIRARAGIVGARRGGWLGFHRWPVAVRLGIFTLLVVAFWGGILWSLDSGLLPLNWIVVAALLAVVIYITVRTVAWAKRTSRRAAARRAEKQFSRPRTQNRAQPDPY